MAQKFPKPRRPEPEEKNESPQSKLDPAVVLYFPSEDIGDDAGARCCVCMMFIEDHCTVVEGPINGESGVCGLYVHGEHDGPDMRGMMAKEVAGYIDTGAPTHCGNCEYYRGDKEAGPCEKVSGTVQFHGCCNAWESDQEEKHARDE